MGTIVVVEVRGKTQLFPQTGLWLEANTVYFQRDLIKG